MKAPTIHPKRCACGAIYFGDAWDQLRFVGVQNDEDDGSRLVLRACVACGSCLAVEDCRLTPALLRELADVHYHDGYHRHDDRPQVDAHDERDGEAYLVEIGAALDARADALDDTVFATLDACAVAS